MGVHDGHRDRMKQTFIEHGLTSFNDVNALELLLYYAIPRRDTNIMAHNLISHFGNLSAVLDASIEELCDVPGVGENAAVLLKLIPQIMKKALISEVKENIRINNSDDAGKYLVPRFTFETDELVLMLCMDSQSRVIKCVEMGRGIVNSVDINIRRLVETALKCKAASVIISHNHPDGVALPSVEDSAVTKQIYTSMATVGITLVDHIIVAGGDFISFADSGMMNYYMY